MAGILNKKERIMDVIVTREGRRQMTDGNLRATFASFTDNMAFYEKDAVSGSTDPTNRLYFEAFSTEADQIIYESDDSGRLVGEINQPDLTIFGDQIFKKNAQGKYLEITGSVFASEVEGIVTASIYNFRSQQIIGSEKGDSTNNKQFDLTRNKLYFNIDNFSPFGSVPNDYLIDLQAATPLFFDRRLANLPQFKFLPPEKTDGTDVANFTDKQTATSLEPHEVIGPLNPYQYNTQETYFNAMLSRLYPQDDVINQDIITQNASENYNAYNTESTFAEAVSNNEFIDPIRKETVNFLNTSDHNRLFCQVFEVNAQGNNKKLVKLDVLPVMNFEMSKEHLDFAASNGFDQLGHESKRFYYVGKVFEDSFGVPSFVRIFTLMFD
jgi:hypothetical protein